MGITSSLHFSISAERGTNSRLKQVAVAYTKCFEQFSPTLEIFHNWVPAPTVFPVCNCCDNKAYLRVVSSAQKFHSHGNKSGPFASDASNARRLSRIWNTIFDAVYSVVCSWRKHFILGSYKFLLAGCLKICPQKFIFQDLENFSYSLPAWFTNLDVCVHISHCLKGDGTN